MNLEGPAGPGSGWPDDPATPDTPVARNPAEVRVLALTHVSSRYAGGELRDEARAIFAATEAPRDFDTIEVPFPERGMATLLRWSERQARERQGGENPGKHQGEPEIVDAAASAQAEAVSAR